MHECKRLQFSQSREAFNGNLINGNGSIPSEKSPLTPFLQNIMLPSLTTITPPSPPRRPTTDTDSTEPLSPNAQRKDSMTHSVSSPTSVVDQAAPFDHKALCLPLETCDLEYSDDEEEELPAPPAFRSCWGDDDDLFGLRFLTEDLMPRICLAPSSRSR